MPETRFEVRWPDGEKQRCYSPSLVIKELLISGQEYPVFEFMERSRAALNIAAERVRLKFGFYCSAATDQLRQFEERAERYDQQGLVQVGEYDD